MVGKASENLNMLQLLSAKQKSDQQSDGTKNVD